MKTLYNLIFCLVLSSSLFAQKTMDAGYIKMEITEVSAENEEMAMGANMLKGSETEYYFDNDHVLVKQSMMGGMVSNSTLMYVESEKVELYIDMMGQKMFIESSKSEMSPATDSLAQDELMKGMEVSYDKSDTKKILGYECYKAKISSPDNTGIEMNFCISEEIKADPKMIQGLSEFDLKGFPLELTMNVNGMKLVFTTIELKDKFDSSVFKIDSTGFVKMTFEEFQNTIGQMGGGMGF